MNIASLHEVSVTPVSSVHLHATFRLTFTNQGFHYAIFQLFITAVSCLELEIPGGFLHFLFVPLLCDRITEL